jgi:TRAP-type C4-dicarboxylate transport system permease small subunit
MLQLIDKLSDYCGIISGILFFAIGGMITYEVTARYGFTAPTIWAEELSRFFQIWAVYLAAAYVLRHGKLIRITMLIDRLNTRGRKLAEAFSLLAISAFALIAIWQGLVLVLESLEFSRTTTSVFAVPMWMTEIAIPLGAGLLLLQCMAMLIRLVRGEELDFGSIEEQL